ncbi:MAG: ATP-binding protein, partial [Thioalkalivibrio sp.]
VAVLFNDEARRKRLELLYDIQPDLPHQLVGDALRLSQVLTNLLSNAIKFTDEGGMVKFAIRMIGSAQASRARIEFSVRDTGIGMTREQMISQRLLEKMGGKLHADSEVGKGSVFTFTLDLPVVSEEQPFTECPPTEGKRVLLVDDLAEARLILQKMLEHCDYEVQTAKSGEQAIEQVRQAESDDRTFDFILMDWKMPGGMDGDETIRELTRMREAGELRRTNSPVLITSAYNR